MRPCDTTYSVCPQGSSQVASRCADKIDCLCVCSSFFVRSSCHVCLCLQQNEQIVVIALGCFLALYLSFPLRQPVRPSVRLNHALFALGWLLAFYLRRFLALYLRRQITSKEDGFCMFRQKCVSDCAVKALRLRQDDVNSYCHKQRVLDFPVIALRLRRRRYKRVSMSAKLHYTNLHVYRKMCRCVKVHVCC